MRVGELSRHAGVNVETVRFYERKGLLPAPQRQPSGYRVYDDTGLKRLRFIKRAQELGFTLREIHELLELRVQQGSTCGDIKARASRHLRDVEEKLRSLREVRKALQQLIDLCDGDRLVGDCPIVIAAALSSKLALGNPPGNVVLYPGEAELPEPSTPRNC